MGKVKPNTGLGRRDFVKTASVAAALGAGATVMPKAAQATANKVHYGMLVDLRRCTGCQACSVACKAEFDVPLGNVRSWVGYTEKGTHADAARSFLPRLCNHCSEPPCVPVCPVDATWKRDEDGIVIVDPDKCVGDGSCVTACPYEARYLNPVTNKAEKCDFCLHRIKNGVVPSCVNTCVGSARIFGDLNDPDSEIAKLIAANPVKVLEPENDTKPNVYYIGLEHEEERAAQSRGEYVRVTANRAEQRI